MATKLAAQDTINDRYRVIRPLGHGQAGSAFLVEDLIKNTRVALKLVDGQSPALINAFRQEFAFLSQSLHPNLTRVHDFGLILGHQKNKENIIYYTADFIEGQDLASFAQGKNWHQILGPISQALSALAFLHTSEILHGDFKAENVLVSNQGQGILIDLSCARKLHSKDAPSGTLTHLAPEVLDGRPSDGRADLYAVGITLKMLLPIIDEEPPEKISKLIARMTHGDLAQRPADVSEVLGILGVTDTLANVSSGFSEHSLVGRAHIIQKAENALSRFLKQERFRRVFWLTGPQGIGKSRVLQEIKWLSQLRTTVHEGYAEGPAPWTSLLQHITGQPKLDANLGDTLKAYDLLEKRSPQVVIFDDLHKLTENQKTLFDAFARSIDLGDPILIFTASEKPPSPSEYVEIIELEPLDETSIRQWVSPILSDRSIPAIIKITSGFPSRIGPLADAIASGQMSEAEVLDLKSSAALMKLRASQINALSVGAKKALAIICALDGHLGEVFRHHLGIALQDLHELQVRGWLMTAQEGYKLHPSVSSSAPLEFFDETQINDMYSQINKVIGTLISETDDGVAKSELKARQATILAQSGQTAEAQKLIGDESLHHSLALESWKRSVEVLRQRLPQNPELALIHARLASEGGDPDISVQLLEKLIHSSPDKGSLPSISIEIAKNLLKLGEIQDCLASIEKAEEQDPSTEQEAATKDVKSRALIQMGRFDKAHQIAEAGLLFVRENLPEHFELQASLHESLGVCKSYLGNAEKAREHLKNAEKLHVGKGLGHPRDMVRIYNYQALNEYRSGNVSGAISAYSRAFSLAEENVMSDRLANSSLNLGTAYHQSGDWGKAYEYYEKGLRIARALGFINAAHYLRFNLAQLFADIGAFDRSESTLGKLRQWAEDEKNLSLLGGIDSLIGEIHLQKGFFHQAVEALERSLVSFESIGSHREVSEVLVQKVLCLIELGRLDEAEKTLEKAGQEKLSASDLESAFLLAQGKILLAQKRGDQAIVVLERALEKAQKAQRHELEAEARITLGRACLEQGAHLLAQKHNRAGSEIWERIGATLPAKFRDVFKTHPRRTTVIRADQVTDEPGEDSAAKLIRLLEINRKLSSSLKTDDVLHFTMDAAIELTGAERGFLILKKKTKSGKSSFYVPIARNIDREKIGKSKYSHSIAEQVIADGEPLLTVDALSDERFRENVSIHAMKLRSVICVPVRSPSGNLGALYLDNRFQRGRFRDQDLSILMAFGDQVAIALLNAKLVSDLEERTKQLEEERKRIQAMVADQAEQIDRLTEDLRTRDQNPSPRYSYNKIVGRSPALNEVLAVVDRVTDAPFPVLIQGQSGTGKELIAQAIHSNSARADHPFVTVNCAALPEALLESELFGHIRGAFTGAVRDRVGLFVEARGGTLFLDELGEIPSGMQAKLLRVLQDQKVRAVGSEQEVEVDVRLVAATNRQLKDEVQAGRFREDLYYRVAVVEIDLPSLRDRVEDIPDLCQHFLRELCEQMHRDEPKLTARGLNKLIRYDWPGNIRQLRNILSRALVLAEGTTITEHDIELPAAERQTKTAGTRKEFEKDEAAKLRAALGRNQWNVSEVSRELNIPRTTLYRKLKKYGLLDNLE